jgi:hypothetical protein
MHPDIERLTKSFLLPNRTLAERLTAAAIAARGPGRLWAHSAARSLQNARRFGALFPEGPDSTTYIARKYNVLTDLANVVDSFDDFLPIKAIWTYFKCVTRRVNPKIAKLCLHAMSERLILLGHVSARDASECSDTFHSMLTCAVGYVRGGWTPETISPFHFE